MALRATNVAYARIDKCEAEVWMKVGLMNANRWKSPFVIVLEKRPKMHKNKNMTNRERKRGKKIRQTLECWPNWNNSLIQMYCTLHTEHIRVQCMCVGRPAGCATTAHYSFAIGLGRDEYHHHRGLVHECENKGSKQHATTNWRKRDKWYLMNNDHFIRPSFCSGKIFSISMLLRWWWWWWWLLLFAWTYESGEMETVLCGNGWIHGRLYSVVYLFRKNIISDIFHCEWALCIMAAAI